MSANKCRNYQWIFGARVLLNDTCDTGMIVPANVLCTNNSATLSKPLDSGAFKIDVGVVVELRINGVITKMRCFKYPPQVIVTCQ